MKCAARFTGVIATACVAASGAWSAAEAAKEPKSGGAPAHTIAEPSRIIGESNAVPQYAREITSKVFTIDRILRSMQGPDSVSKLALWEEPGHPELLWITGYRAVMTANDAVTTMSSEFMCHSNLILGDGDAYRKRFPSRLRIVAERSFSLDQGSLTVAFPEGTGVPIMSDQMVLFNSQVLKHNIVGPPFDLRQKVYVDFVRDADLPKPMLPLVQHGVLGLVLLEGEDGHYGMSSKDLEAIEHGPGCSLGDDVGHVQGSFEDTEDAGGSDDEISGGRLRFRASSSNLHWAIC